MSSAVALVLILLALLLMTAMLPLTYPSSGTILSRVGELSSNLSASQFNLIPKTGQ